MAVAIYQSRESRQPQRFPARVKASWRRAGQAWRGRTSAETCPHLQLSFVHSPSPLRPQSRSPWARSTLRDSDVERILCYPSPLACPRHQWHAALARIRCPQRSSMACHPHPDGLDMPNIMILWLPRSTSPQCGSRRRLRPTCACALIHHQPACHVSSQGPNAQEGAAGYIRLPARNQPALFSPRPPQNTSLVPLRPAALLAFLV